MKRIIFFFSIIIGFSYNYANSQTIGFHTDSKGRLLDDNGNEFIMRGINIPLAWYSTEVLNSISKVRTNTNSNCVRIGLLRSTPDAVWQQAVQKCIDNNMIPMLELHDFTGSTNTNDPNTAAQWFASKASFLNRSDIKKHILINICNEWGDWWTATNDAANPNGGLWLSSYTPAIQTLRNAGITTTLVIDAVGYGQDINTAKNIRDDAKTMMASDASFLGASIGNLIFSIHMYCEWKKGADDPAIVNTIKNTDHIPVMIGEFGFDHGCDIDEVYIMEQCEAAGVGWLAWSQKGNGGGVQYLDLCSDWNCTMLSGWGNTIVNAANGTKSGETCSVFLSNNVRPTVALTSPNNNASFESPITLIITATASDADGTVTKVEFFNGTTSLGVDNSSPYSITLNNPAVGNYSITAVATDNSNGTTSSTPIVFNVTTLQCPVPNLGIDKFICSNSSLLLDANVAVAGATYSWQRNNSAITGTKSTLTITNTGTYKVITSKPGCNPTSDVILIKSGDLMVTNDVLCKNGIANLAVSGGTGGTYKWYATASSSAVLETGNSYSPTVSGSTTYYVQEESTIGSITKETIGQLEQVSNSTKWDINDFATNDKQVKITVTSEITLDAIAVYPVNSNTNVTIRIVNTANNQVITSKTVNNLATGKQRIPLNALLSPGTYILDAMGTSDKLAYDANSGSFPYEISGKISIAGNAAWVQEQGRYGCFYAWEFSYGQIITKAVCSRMPATVTIDPNRQECVISGSDYALTNNAIDVFPNPTLNQVQINRDFTGNWYLFSTLGEIVLHGKENWIDMTELSSGIYSLKIENQIIKIIKQ